ncbi:MAG: beta-ketoacyl-[acyl-carrier-protein] synthase family protein [bacterium]
MFTSKPRVVITGLGTVNPIGNNINDFWSNCVSGKSGIKYITDFKLPESISQISGIANKFKFNKHDFEYNNEQLDRSLEFSLTATKEALEDSNLINNNFKKNDWKICLATAISQIQSMVNSFAKQSQCGKIPIKMANHPIEPKEKRKYNRFLFNSISDQIASEYGITGGSATIATGCTGGLDSIIYSTHLIRNKKASVVIAGATEVPITPLVLSAFSKIGAVSKRDVNPYKASCPFDVKRDGFVLAEGCGIIILEDLSHSLKRNAFIYGEVAGVASVNSCFHMTNIPENGQPIAEAIRLAIQDSQTISENDIDYINVHGSSTLQNDIAESNALNSIFKHRIKKIPVSANKSTIGHALSAANIIEIISCSLTLRDNIIPPTINLEVQDKRCKLNVLANSPKKQNVNCILKIGSGFSGLHSSMILKRYKK